jgi:hypothetical protein
MPDMMQKRGRLERRWKSDSAWVRLVVTVAATLGALACGDGDGDDYPAFELLTVVVHPGGFGGADAGPASTCSARTHRDTFEVDGPSLALSFDLCSFEAPDIHTLRQGHRALTESQLESIGQTLARLDTGTPEWMCGADAGFITLDVRKEASTELYISSSYCPMEFSAGRTPATGIPGLRMKLSELSGK